MSKSYSYLGDKDLVQIKSVDITPDLSTTNIYVSTLGNDSNDGETSLTPFLTLEKAFNSIPNLIGGVYQVNIADGTYQLVDVYSFKNPISSVGNSDWNSVIKVVGNIVTPGNVIIKAKDTSSTAFTIYGNSMLVDFNGIDIRDCNIGVFADGARFIFRNVNVTNYGTDGIVVAYQSHFNIPTGGTGVTLASNGTSASSQGVLSTSDSLVLIQSPITITGFKGSGSRGLTAILNSHINLVSTATITAEATSGAENGILAAQYGQVVVSGTASISNIKDVTFAGSSGGIAARDSGRVSIASGSTINFTDCYNDFLVQAGSSVVETTGGSTYNHTGATNKVVVYESGVVDSANYLNGGVIVYRALQFAGPVLGYDNRYGLINSSNLWGQYNVFKSIGLSSGAVNIYVSSVGSDSNDGLTIGTPKLTLDGVAGAFSLLPLLVGDVYTINIADGTYQLSAVYEFPHLISNLGDSDYKSVIKILGNTVTPSNVVIKAATTSTNIFNIFSKHTLIDIDGVQFQDCSSALNIDGGRCILRAVNITNHFNPGPAIAINNGQLTWAAGTGGRVITSAASGGPGGIFVQRYGIFEQYCDISILGTRNNSAFSIGNYGRFIQQTGVANTTLTADAVVGGNAGIFIGGNGVATIRGTWNLENFNNASGTTKAGINLTPQSYLTVVSGSIFNFTTCTNGFVAQTSSAWIETGVCTWNMTAVTTPITLQHGCQINDNNSFGGQPIVYTVGNFVFHGYDARYVRSTPNLILVDSTNGVDAVASRGGIPFKTPEAALAVAQFGDIIQCFPGTYNLSAGITIPDGVNLKGISSFNCTLQMLNVTADTDLVTMGVSSRLEDLTLKLTSAEHHTLRGVVWPSTSTATAKNRRVVLIVDNSTASDIGTSNVYGHHITGTGTPSSEVIDCRAETVTVTSAGLGDKRAILVDSAAYFNINEVNTKCTRVGAGAGSYIAEETNNAGAIIRHKSGSIEGSPTADISQTLGSIELTAPSFVNGGANGKSFTSLGGGFQLIFSDPGALPNSVTRYMRPGTGTVDASEIKIRMGKKSIIRHLSVRALVAPGAGLSDVFTVRKNGVDTVVTCTLADTNLSADSSNTSAEFLENDDLSIQIITGATATQDVVVSVDIY